MAKIFWLQDQPIKGSDGGWVNKIFSTPSLFWLNNSLRSDKLSQNKGSFRKIYSPAGQKSHFLPGCDQST
jgi:hypothetical protein